jgi:hypothetical protein
MALNITIAGSYGKHLDRILSVRDEFIDLGVNVLRPPSSEKIINESITRLQGDPDDLGSIRQEQLQAIYRSDLLYIVNPGGYVGSAATLDAGFAHALRIPVWSAEPVFEDAVSLIITSVGSPRDLIREEG